MEKIKEELFAWVDDIEDKDSEEDEFAIVSSQISSDKALTNFPVLKSPSFRQS